MAATDRSHKQVRTGPSVGGQPGPEWRNYWWDRVFENSPWGFLPLKRGSR